MRRVRYIGLVLLSAWLASAVWAGNPELRAHEEGIDDRSRESQSLRMSLLHLDVDIVGSLADVSMTARFSNASGDILEGDFSFELPEGAVVTGYALDVGETMIDGVLVDPLKAQHEYEVRVREGIDPGVAHVSRANLFTTRVFPIPDSGSRTIRLRFSAPVHALRGLRIPLSTREAVGDVGLRIRTSAIEGRPAITLPNDLPVNWRPGADESSLSIRLADRALSGELRIAPVKPGHAALATRHSNGKRFAHIVDTATRAAAPRTQGRRLRVYWDRSRSRRDQDLAAERRLLSSYVEATAPASIDLVEFNSSGARTRRLKASELDAALQAVVYRGATSFAVLEKPAAPAADVCLWFTDGVTTIDARPFLAPDCERFAITSAADADRGMLMRLAGGAGAVFDLNSQGAARALEGLQGGGLRVSQVLGADGRPLAFTTLDAGPDGWSVVAQAPTSGDVIVRIAGAQAGILERRYSPAEARRQPFQAAASLWAFDRAAELAAEDGEHKTFVDFSRQYSVASAALSFIVLETPEDYVAAGIAPPSNYPKKLAEPYRELLAESEAERKVARTDRLEEVLGRWNEVLTWWSSKSVEKNDDDEANPVWSGAAAPIPAPAATASGRPEAVMAEDIGRPRDEAASRSAQRSARGEVDEIMVTGHRASRSAMPVIDARARTPEIEIVVPAWNVKRPYIQALDAASPADVDRLIAEQERQHGELPIFYFDVAEWLWRRGRAEDAREMLLSALDLPAANAQTVSAVAHRALRFGALDRAVWLFERAAERIDFLPQPRRSLALALEMRARGASRAQARKDLRRAVALLDEVIMTPSDGDYDGIEVISLMEANAMLPRLRSLGVRDVPLDRRLRKRMDLDIRVVVEWNTPGSDMDLWVREPTGEEAHYNNPLTEIGGRLSNDMTDGYGPEEYLLRRAPAGEYQIRVDVYDTDEINPNGATVVTARLYRNWGRPNQKEETMEIELAPGQEDEVMVGTFKVR